MYSMVVVDEAQDMSPAQLLLAQILAGENGRMVYVGDPAQCHPAGTLVEITGGEQKRIEDVKAGDMVVTYHDCFRGIRSQGRLVEATGVRQFEGDMLTLKAAGEEVRVTPNHKIPTRMRSDLGQVWVTYLMETGSFSRVGSCLLRYVAQGKQGAGVFGPSMRLRHERADRVWVLGVYYNERESRIQETVTACQFGLPENCGFEKGAYKQDLIDAIGDNRAKALACLASFGREYAYPIAQKGNPAHIGSYLYVTQACNLLPGVNEVRTYDGTRDGGSWAPLEITKEKASCPVYSLQVQPTEGGHRLYVADGILVHNCIYGFRGADTTILERAATEMKAKVLNLNITYRCPKKIVELAQRYVPDFTAAVQAPEGEVHEGVLEKFMLEQASSGDFILCRANAPLMSVCLKLIAAGKRAYMAGRDVGEKLLSILRKVQGRKAFQDMADLELRLQRWADRENDKISRTTKNPDSAASKHEAIEDILGIFHALAEGLEEPADIEGELKRLFQEPGLTNKDFVCCSTVHKAKGLEADNVWILAQGFNRPGAEENNIRYVAITRAKKRLYAVGFAFEGSGPKNLDEALEQADKEGRDADFEPHKLESNRCEFVTVESGDFASKYFVRFGSVAEGSADNWDQIGALLDSWLPGREWQIDGVAWQRKDLFASAEKHIPKAFADANS